MSAERRLELVTGGMAITPEFEVIEEGNRLPYAVAILMHWQERCRLGLQGMTRDEFLMTMTSGEMLLLSMAGIEVGALMFSMIIPDEKAEAHIIRWGKMPRPEWQWLCGKACAWLFERYPEMKRIEAWFPVSNNGAVRIAKAVGFRIIGVMPEGVKISPGNFEDLAICALKRDWLKIPSREG